MWEMARALGFRALVVVALVAGAAGAGSWAWSAYGPRPESDPTQQPTAAHANLRALTAEEETFAASLWAVHGQVKLAAVRMSFAGISYKIGNHDAAQLRSAVEPVIGELEEAGARVRDIVAPTTMAALHAQYLEALSLYRNAATDMLQGAAEASDERLLAGQELSFRASEEILRVGDQLWPTEHKPH
jgi:hypothetical protein